MTATMVDANENFWGKLDLREYLFGREETNCDLAVGTERQFLEPGTRIRVIYSWCIVK